MNMYERIEIRGLTEAGINMICDALSKAMTSQLIELERVDKSDVLICKYKVNASALADQMKKNINDLDKLLCVVQKAGPPMRFVDATKATTGFADTLSKGFEETLDKIDDALERHDKKPIPDKSDTDEFTRIFGGTGGRVDE